MKKLFLFLFIILICFYLHSQDFSSYFTDNTLFIEIIHTGDCKFESFSIKRFRKSNLWAGPKKNLIDKTKFGKYYYRVFDKKTKKLLFSHGYCSLFGEWQTINESRRLVKSFQEVLKIPYPVNPIEIKIYTRSKDNKSFEEKFSFSFNPSNDIVNKDLPKEYKSFEFGKIKPVNNALDILIVGEGYTNGELKKFKKDFENFSGLLLETAPYKQLKYKINIRGLFVESIEKGSDQPTKDSFKNTAFDTKFNTFKLPRYLNTYSIHKLNYFASALPFDILTIMVNTDRYGGSGIYNFYSIFTADNKNSNYVYLHELGHNLGGLGDEYYTSKVTYSNFYPPGVEPWEPNITALLDKDNLKWKSFVEPTTPIPTPNIDKYKDKVGAFEGAGYVAKGLYRPVVNCIMFNGKNFCPVCQNAIKQRILHFSN